MAIVAIFFPRAYGKANRVIPRKHRTINPVAPHVSFLPRVEVAQAARRIARATKPRNRSPISARYYKFESITLQRRVRKPSVPQRRSELTVDEQALRNTSLKDFFFDHLSANSDKAQFMVIENIDLPPDIEQLAQVVTFTGDPLSGRQGLLYTHRAQ